MTTPLDCLREAAPCMLQPTVEAHGRQLDAAHSKLWEHESLIKTLSAQTLHYLERLVKVEASTGEQHRMMAEMQGSLEAVRLEQTGILRAVETLAETHQSTHALLTRHIDINVAQTEAAHLTRLAHVERISVRLIKIATAGTLIAGLLGMLYSLLAGKPLLSIFTGST